MSEEDSKKHWPVNLITTFVDVIGILGTGVMIGVLSQVGSDSEFIFHRSILSVALAIGSYSGVALFLQKVHSQRKIPDWILVAILGSTVYTLCIVVMDTITYGWKIICPQADEGVLSYLERLIIGLGGITTIDSVIALLIMGVFHLISSKLSSESQIDIISIR
jgi:hypothetical protein